MAIWASDCAKHTLPYFEERYPEDGRPCQAIGTARVWVRDNLAIVEARKTAFAAHAAAREAKHAEVQAAARTAGHAAATTHVADHARYTAARSSDDSTVTESDWHVRHLPEHLRSVAFLVPQL